VSKEEPAWPQGLIKEVIEQPAFLYSGVRKIVQDITWEIKELPVLDYGDLGYAGNKVRQMHRNYFNPNSMEQMRTLLDHRAGQSFSAMAMSLKHAEKDSRSQGHCMQTLIVSWKRDLEIVEVQYRSTEIIQKFGADLVFLREVFEELDLNPDLIRFRFSNAYLSGVFFPTLGRFWNMIDFLEYLHEHDYKLFCGATRFFLRSAYKEDQWFPYSPENIQHKLGWKHLDMKQIRKYLHQKHKEIGKPLPRQHHTKPVR